MSNLEATIVVEFNGGGSDTSDYIARIQLDSVANEDKSSFLPGDEPVFEANFSSNVRVDNVISLEGSIRDVGTATRSEVFSNVFTSVDVDEPTTYQLPVVPSGTSISYKGRGGLMTSEISSTGILTYTGDVGKAPFQAFIDTTYAAKLYRLTPPEITLEANETYEVIIVFYLTLV